MLSVRLMFGRLLSGHSNTSNKSFQTLQRCALLNSSKPGVSTIVCQFHDNSDNRVLTDTSAIVQEGLHIDELPCIVRIVHGEFVILDSGRTRSGTKFHGIRLQTVPLPENLKKVNKLEEEEMIGGFNRCSSLSELYFLLSYCPQDEVTAPVALAIIKNLIQLENNKKFRNPNLLSSSLQAEEYKWSNRNAGPHIITFTRAAVMERLVDTICKDADPGIVTETVKVLKKDTNKEEKSVYLKKLCDECLVLVSDGKLSVAQIVSLAQDLHLLKENFSKEFADKLWPGLEAGIQDLDADGLCDLFSMLPFINLSRNYVFYLAEKRALNIWYKFKPDHIIQIVSILVTCQCHSHKLVSAISRWTNVTIHTLTEGDIRWILLAFTKLGFTDQNIQNAIARYTKARKSMIVDSSLVSVIMDYCSTTRFRSPEVLDVCAEYFIKYNKSLSVPDVWTICQTFGLLNYVPKNNFEFFKILEELLEKHFVAFSPDSFMDLLLACVYLERFPLNFVKKVYHPFFFRRIEYLSPKDAKQTLTKLRILDKAMSLESSCYNGPMMRSVQGGGWLHRDARVLKCVLHLRKVLREIAGDPNRLFISAQLHGFPLTDLYRVDCLIDTTIKPDLESVLPAGLHKRLALLVHVPEHYDLSKEHLLGAHAMRVRHFRLVSLEVVNLQYEILSRYYSQPQKAKEYIVEQIMASLHKVQPDN